MIKNTQENELIKEFILKSLKPNYNETFEIDFITQKSINKINLHLNLKSDTQKRFFIYSNAIRHICNEHGAQRGERNKKKADEILFKKEDYLQIIDVLEYPDEIKYSTKNSVRFVKYFSGKTMCCIMRKKYYDDFELKTAYQDELKGIVDILEVTDFYIEKIKDNSDSIGALRNEYGQFVDDITKRLRNGESLDLAKVKKIAKDYPEITPDRLLQLCEVAVVLASKCIIAKETSLRAKFEELVDLYNRQPTITPNNTKSLLLQQYSTPCPLAFLAGKYVESNTPNAHYLEPCAGNGLLTISLPAEKTHCNELDTIRYENLTLIPYLEKRENKDATDLKTFRKIWYDGVIMNPPFSKLDKKDFLDIERQINGERAVYTIKKLDYKIAINALESMKSNGKSAVIVGGDLMERYFNERGMMYGQRRTFIQFLHRQYVIEDIIYISGDWYRKQGTTFPICLILINGRQKWNNETKHQPPTYNPDKDTPIQTFDELFARILPHLTDTPPTEPTTKSNNKAKAKLLLKIKITKTRLRLLEMERSRSYVKLNGVEKKNTTTAITIMVIDKSNRSLLKRRDTTARFRLVRRGVMNLSGTNIYHENEITKLNQLILKLDTKKYDDNTFVFELGECFSDEIEREIRYNHIFESKYQDITFENKDFSVVIRASTHNTNCYNVKEKRPNAKQGYSATLKSKRTKNTFKPNPDVNFKEFVYLSENNDNKRYKKIVQSIISLFENGVYEDYASAEYINISTQESKQSKNKTSN